MAVNIAGIGKSIAEPNANAASALAILCLPAICKSSTGNNACLPCANHDCPAFSIKPNSLLVACPSVKPVCSRSAIDQLFTKASSRLNIMIPVPL